MLDKYTFTLTCDKCRWRDHIVTTPDTLRGKPRIRGTRIPVSLILGYLAAGSHYDEIIAQFPDLTSEHISACLDYARDLSEFETIATADDKNPTLHGSFTPQASACLTT